MSSLFIIGETGESTVISSFSQFKTHIDLFLKNTSCTLNDILIYTNKGQSYISSLPNEITPETHYFIYTKKHSPDLITIFRNSLISFSNPFSHNISLDLKCIPDIKYVTSSIPLLEENAKYLNSIMKKVPAESINIMLNTSVSPVLIVEKDTVDTRFVLSPIHVA